MQHIVINNFLNTYKELKDYSLKCEFNHIENPSDGVIYPYICTDIPEEVNNDVCEKLTKFLGREPKNITMFLRMSPAGVTVPHVAHTDALMGTYSLMLYLQTNSDSGTAFLRHKESGITYHPEHELFKNLITRDQNNTQSWQIYNTIESVENKALIFDAALVHCAYPVGGYGTTQRDSRIVLTCFFS